MCLPGNDREEKIICPGIIDWRSSCHMPSVLTPPNSPGTVAHLMAVVLPGEVQGVGGMVAPEVGGGEEEATVEVVAMAAVGVETLRVPPCVHPTGAT